MTDSVHPLVEAAREWRALGQHVVPVRQKMPYDVITRHGVADWENPTVVDAIPLSAFEDARVTGIGLLLGYGYIDIDVDDTEFDISALPATRMAKRGERIQRCLYRCDTPTKKIRDPERKKMIVEIRGRGLQSVIPPSVHQSGEPCVWCGPDAFTEVDGGELTRLVVATADRLLKTRYGADYGKPTQRAYTAAPVTSDPSANFKRARAWIRKHERAVQGQGHHHLTNATAVDLAIGFALGEQEALSLLSEWNELCEPKRPVRELAKIIAWASKTTDKPMGYKLNDPKHQRDASPNVDTGASYLATQQSPPSVSPAASAPRSAPPATPSASATPEPDWRAGLLYTTSKTGVVTYSANVANAKHLLMHHPEAKSVLAFDDFKQATVVTRDAPFAKAGREWTDCDDTEVTIWMQRMPEIRLKITVDVVRQAVAAAAQENRYDSLRDYLESLEWDGVPRIDTWLTTYAGVPDEQWTRLVAPKILIALVARGFSPGEKVDTMFVLEGKQGKRKSTLLRELVGVERFADRLADIGTRDAATQLQGVWLLEFAEMDGLDRGSVNRIKSFLTEREDRWVGKWEKHARRVPRVCCFAGSCNRNDYLRDETGNRRFWPVECVDSIDVDGVRKDRDQLFAEAVVRYRNHERWHLDGDDELSLADEQQSARCQNDAWDDLIEQALIGQNSVTIADVLGHIVRDHYGDKHPERWGQTEQNRVARCLLRMGWERCRALADNGKRAWKYVRPGHTTGHTTPTQAGVENSVRPSTTHTGTHTGTGIPQSSRGGVPVSQLSQYVSHRMRGNEGSLVDQILYRENGDPTGTLGLLGHDGEIIEESKNTILGQTGTAEDDERQAIKSE